MHVLQSQVSFSLAPTSCGLKGTSQPLPHYCITKNLLMQPLYKALALTQGRNLVGQSNDL